MPGLMISAYIWMWFGEINHANNAAVVQKMNERTLAN